MLSGWPEAKRTVHKPYVGPTAVALKYYVCQKDMSLQIQLPSIKDNFWNAGGSGMIFSSKLVEKMTDPENPFCKCPSPESYDDVHLGFCCNRFHQGIPEDYVTSVLEETDPISFHHFTNTDPRKNYANWFKSADQQFLKTASQHHHELWIDLIQRHFDKISTLALVESYLRLVISYLFWDFLLIIWRFENIKLVINIRTCNSYRW